MAVLIGVLCVFASAPKMCKIRVKALAGRFTYSKHGLMSASATPDPGLPEMRGRRHVAAGLESTDKRRALACDATKSGGRDGKSAV